MATKITPKFVPGDLVALLDTKGGISTGELLRLWPEFALVDRRNGPPKPYPLHRLAPLVPAKPDAMSDFYEQQSRRLIGVLERLRSKLTDPPEVTVRSGMTVEFGNVEIVVDMELDEGADGIVREYPVWLIVGSSLCGEPDVVELGSARDARKAAMKAVTAWFEQEVDDALYEAEDHDFRHWTPFASGR